MVMAQRYEQIALEHEQGYYQLWAGNWGPVQRGAATWTKSWSTNTSYTDAQCAMNYSAVSVMVLALLKML